MSTSTTLKITDSLWKQAEDKKPQLNARYQSHSIWLQNELEKIRMLITQNADVPPPSEQVAEKPVEEQGRSKRKGPEAEIQGVASPEQKRNSSDNSKEEVADMESLFAAAGLPADLNKLRKEQLLVELEARQITSFTMKSLKKDLIDALRDCIQRSHRQRPKGETSAPSSSGHVSTSFEGTISTGDACIGTTKEPSPIGSLLQTFRKSIAISEAPAEEDKSARIQNEFEARQRRHRDSQSAMQSSAHNDSETANTVADNRRESIASTVYSAIVSEYSGDNDDTCTVENVVVRLITENTNIDAMNTQDSIQESPMDRSEEIVTDTKVEAVEGSQEEEREEEESAGSVWMEVASPAPQKATTNTNSELHEDNLASRILQSTSATADSNPVEQAKQPATVAVVSAPQKPTTIDPQAASEPVPVNAVSTATTTTVNKKPTNLLAATGPASFLDSLKPVVQEKVQSKPVVAALEKARQLKEIEEAKALERAKNAKALEEARQRKKEQMLAQAQAASGPQSGKSTAKTATSNSSSSTTFGSSTASNSGASASSAASTTTIASSGISTVKKALNMVGTLINKKPTATTPSAPSASAAPATITANTSSHGRAGSLSSNVRPISAQPKLMQTFDISVVNDTPTSVEPSPTASSVHEEVEDEEEIEEGQVTEEREEVINSQLAVVQTTSCIVPAVVAVAPQAPQIVHIIESEPEAENVAPAAQQQAATIPTAIANALATAPTSAQTSTSSKSQPLREVAVVEEEDDYDPANQYPMDDKDDSGSDTDDDEEAQQKKRDMVPQWARGPNLKEALDKQYGLNGHTPMDPDTIFHEINTCSLEEIFGCKQGPKSGVLYSKRTSSAHWDADQVSLVEKRNYRQFLGFRPSIAPGGVSPPKAIGTTAGTNNSSHMMSMPVNANRPITSIPSHPNNFGMR